MPKVEIKQGGGAGKVEVVGMENVLCEALSRLVSGFVVSPHGLLVVGQWLRTGTLEPDCPGPGSFICQLCSSSNLLKLPEFIFRICKMMVLIGPFW